MHQHSAEVMYSPLTLPPTPSPSFLPYYPLLSRDSPSIIIASISVHVWWIYNCSPFSAIQFAAGKMSYWHLLYTVNLSYGTCM